MPFGALLALRLPVIAFFALTSAYAALNCSAFAFDMFIKPQLSPWMAGFVAWHHIAFAVAYLASAVSVWPVLRKSAMTSFDRRAAYLLAWLYVGAGAAVATALMASPFLPTLWNDARAPVAAIAALVPLVLLAAIDCLMGTRVLTPALGPTKQRRLAATAASAVGLLWLVHLARVLLLSGGPQSLIHGLVTALLAFTALGVIFGGVFTMLVLVEAIALRTTSPRLAEVLGTALLLAAAATEFLRRSVLPTISIDPRTSAYLAAAFGITAGFTLAGFAVRRPAARDEDVSGFELVLCPSVSTPAALALLGAVLALSSVALAQTVRIDWSSVGRRTIVLLEWGLAFVLLFRAARGITGGWSPRLALAPLVPVVMFLGFVPLSARAGAWSGHGSLRLDHLSTAEAGLRTATELLVREPPSDPGYYEFLLRHADFSGRTAVTVPDVTLAEPHARASFDRDKRPDIFLFVVDSLRPDYLGAYNPAVTFTPSIDAFAAGAFAFRNAFTRHGGTELAMTSIWTGAAVVRKVRSNGLQRMNALEKLVADNGYRIAINDFTVAEHLRPDTPLTRIDPGVSSVDTDLCSNLDGLRRHLDATRDDPRPVLGFFAPMNVHILNTARREQSIPAGAFPGFYAPYAARLQRLDGCFGGFIEFLRERRRLDDSIIVLTSDHGDSLGENGFWGHAMYLFPEDVRIPLIVHLPPRVAARVTTDLARLAFSTDIAPTLYELLGHPVAPRGEPFGEPLFVAPGGALSDRRRRSYVVTSSYGPTYALIRANGRLLYVADLLEWRESGYHVARTAGAAEVPLDGALRRDSQLQVRDQVTGLSTFYAVAR